MKKLIALIALTLGIAAGSANAAQVTFNAAGNITNASGVRTQFPFGLDNSTPLPTGTIIEFGYFAGGVPAALGSSVTWTQIDALRAGFTKWGTNVINNSSVAGRATNIIQNTLFGGTPPTNQIAIWVWNTANTGTASYVGVYTAPTWLFPVADSGAGSSATIALATNLLNNPSGLLAIAGSFDPVSDPFRQALLAEIVIIPEPSTAILGLVGGLGIMARRRKRS